MKNQTEKLVYNTKKKCKLW